MENIVELNHSHGFSVIAASGMMYFVYYVWTWATKDIKPILNEASGSLIGLIDRIRMLDNDLIRLNQKINIILMLKQRNFYQLKETEF